MLSVCSMVCVCVCGGGGTVCVLGGVCVYSVVWYVGGGGGAVMWCVYCGMVCVCGGDCVMWCVYCGMVCVCWGACVCMMVCVLCGRV